MAGNVMANDVAARDMQAATSSANRIATAKQSLGALRAAALGAGGEPQQQSPSLGLALPIENQSTVITDGLICL